jgi:hypothetical protein
LKKKEYSTEIGTEMNTTNKILHSCKVLHQQNPLFTVEGEKNQNRSQILLHHLGHHKEFGKEATSKKQMLSLTTQQTFFSRILQKMSLKRKKHLFNF